MNGRSQIQSRNLPYALQGTEVEILGRGGEGCPGEAVSSPSPPLFGLSFPGLRRGRDDVGGKILVAPREVRCEVGAGSGRWPPAQLGAGGGPSTEVLWPHEGTLMCLLEKAEAYTVPEYSESGGLNGPMSLFIKQAFQAFWKLWEPLTGRWEMRPVWAPAQRTGSLTLGSRNQGKCPLFQEVFRPQAKLRTLSLGS